jgi:squalene-hopene/tetraprenyl-beta-curcumene cyclase
MRDPRAEQWILERTQHADGLGAIYPSMMYVVMALDCLGYPADHPDVKEANHQFMNLMIDDHRGSFSAVFFAGLGYRHRCTRSGRSRMRAERNLTASADWLLSKEVRRKGD